MINGVEDSPRSQEKVRLKVATGRENAKRPAKSMLGKPDAGVETVRKSTHPRRVLFGELVDTAQALAHELLKHPRTPELSDAFGDLMRFITICVQLFEAFEAPTVDGAGGVAERIFKTRHGVYERLKAIGCEISELKRESTDLDDLIFNNPVLTQIISKIKKELQKVHPKVKRIRWPELCDYKRVEFGEEKKATSKKPK